MKTIRLKPVLLALRGLRLGLTKSVLNFMLIFVENCLLFDAIHDFSV